MALRTCGILMPVASLPGPCGIGSFGKEAYAFVDFLHEAGQKYWQILPLGETGFGDSPYQSFSTFAGNPYFLDLTAFVEAGYLTRKDLEDMGLGKDPEHIDYEMQYRKRWDVLAKACANSPLAPEPPAQFAGPEYDGLRQAFADYKNSNWDWLPDYCLYTAIKRDKKGASWDVWEAPLRKREEAALEAKRQELAALIRTAEFGQFFFREQWFALKDYAHEHDVRIIGDLPIYVAYDSADAWSHPELFKFDAEGVPTVVAGCPPDAFSETGQLWGNPIYNWPEHKARGYAWWISRMGHALTLYDVVRIDHFRGFEAYWEVPYGDETAAGGQWIKGPGLELFTAIENCIGKKEIIAEDLGFLTEDVRKLIKDSGYPGMKVLQFAFDASGTSDYLPHKHVPNCVVYTGTHDNETTRGWYGNMPKADKEFIRRYCGIGSADEAAPGLIKLALMSVADTVIIPLQDYLDLGNEARINHPSTLGGGNWCWRLKKSALTKKLAKEMRDLAHLYSRI